MGKLSAFRQALAILAIILYSVQSYAAVPSTAEWWTAGANLQRTSWVSSEVKGTLAPEWYVTIEPFIKRHIEPIAAAGKIFVTSAGGVYAFNANTGVLDWKYATAMPIINSPTYTDGIVYAAVMDGRIHAIDAATGNLKSGWTFVTASSGYETNPLVVNGKVYAGNRDGYFYCLNATTGALIWKWRDDSDEHPDAPLRYSAAYKNNILYYGSENGHAYALKDNGASASLQWKSPMLPGIGFITYWPVIYTHKSTGKDYVLFTGTKKETGWVWFGQSYFQENYDVFQGISTGAFVGSTGTVSGDWVSGTRTIDASKITQYFAQNPHKRHMFVFDAQTGTEYTSTYAPFLWISASHGGSKYPPIIGSDGVIYSHIGYKNGDPGLTPNGGASGGVSGWKFGTQYVSQIYDLPRGYADEGIQFTAGGNVIYWTEGWNMGYGAFEMNKAYGSNAVWEYASCGGMYGCLGIPGYDQMFNNACDLYGSCNGVTDGGSGALIPYNGRVYMLERNALIAFSINGGWNRKTTATSGTPSVALPSAPASSQFSSKLEAEVSKIVSAGHLRPGFYDSGLWSTSAAGFYEPFVEGDHLGEYFFYSGDTVTTLLQALPYLSPTLQTQVKSYVKNNYGPGATYDFTTIAHNGWKNGAQREIFLDTPERDQLMSRSSDDPLSNIATVPRTYSFFSDGMWQIWKFPQTSFYAGWQYAKVFPGEAATVFNALKSKLEPTASNPKYPTDQQFIRNPYILNAYIAGYRGYVELEKLAGVTSSITQSSKYNEYTRLVNLRVNTFSKDSPIQDSEFTYETNLKIARNFMYMTPELAEILRSNKLTQVRDAITEYQRISPFWFVNRYDGTYGEGMAHPLYDHHGLFLTKAYILKDSYDELAKYIDVPAFHRGDLYYIQMLVALLNSSGTVVSDTTPPQLTNGQPSGTIASATSTTISVTTDEFATCKYSTTTGTAYASKPYTFATTGTTSHTSTVSITAGQTYTYYVRCQDTSGNTNTQDYTITFTVTQSDSTPPTISAGQPTGTLPSSTTNTVLGVTTNEAATCKYSTTSGTAYASKPYTFATTGTTSHSNNIATAQGQSYNYYIRCQDTSGNTNTQDYIVSFTVASQAPDPDVNQDGQINIIDIQLILNDFGKTSSYNPRTDQKQDGKIDIYDVMVVLMNWGPLNNPPPDTTPPSVSFSSPTNNSVIQSTITLTATASDNVQVAGVQFQIDASNIGSEDTSSPYTQNLDTTQFSNGVHTLSARARDSSSNTKTSTIVVTINNPTNQSSGPTVSNLVNNIAEYGTSVPKYSKFELTFDVKTVAGNMQFPFEPNPPAGVDTNQPEYNGVSVDALLLPPGETDWNKAYSQPGFYYREYQDTKKIEWWLGTNHPWIYPTGKSMWKVRFAPNIVGTWSYKIKVRDKSGTYETTPATFQVSQSSNKGFVKVSDTDRRYFEFDNGEPFPYSGFESSVAHSEAIEQFTKYNQNNIRFMRMWISNSFGAAWPEWLGSRNEYDYYMPRTGLEAYTDPATGKTTLTMVIDYEPEGNVGWYDACAFQFGRTLEAVKQNTNYRITVKYHASGMTGPRNPQSPNYGLVIKTAPWLDNCYNSGDGTVLSGYGPNTNGWGYLTGTWNSGDLNFISRMYVALENINQGRANIGGVSVREIFANGSLGPEIIMQNSTQYDTYIADLPMYELEKVLDTAEDNGVYLKLVLLDKNDYIYFKINNDGTYVTSGPDNEEGFYGVGRNLNKIRWLQQAYYRYMQARFGYSTAIHSWEFANEGDPWNSNHYATTDEMGRYLHCTVFGIPSTRADSSKCTYDHPNSHMVTTSFWHSFPGMEFWVAKEYPNIDYADVHAYISTGYLPDQSFETDEVGFHLAYSLDTRSTLDYYSKIHNVQNKPSVRGETGIDYVNSQNEQADLAKDTQGVWLHNFLWSTLHPSAMYEIYWWRQTIDSSPGPDGQPGLWEIYRNLYDFMAGIPISNGYYTDINATISDTRVRVMGQKDLTNNRAHLWIQNKQHSWRNVVDKVNVPQVTGTVTFKMQPSRQYTVQWWNTYATSNYITKTETVTSNSNGDLTISFSALSTDVAIKIT